MEKQILINDIVQICPLEIENEIQRNYNMLKPRIEFTYTRGQDTTHIYIWIGMELQDKLEMPGIMSAYSKKKIKEELIKKYKEK